MARSRNTADTQTASGGPVSPNIAGKNKIINGDFRINQRNFSSTTANNTYTFDRWVTVSPNTSQTFTSQSFTPGAAPVAGYESATFLQCATTASAGAYALIIQKIEDVRTFANQTVTVSFWAKSASGTPKVATQLTQNFGTGGSSNVGTSAVAFTISTSWARYSTTFSIPSISGKTIGTNSCVEASLIFQNDYEPVIGQQTATIGVWGMQVEIGSTATPFQTATGTIQGELAACQRYYYREGGQNAYQGFTQGLANGGTGFQFILNLPVTMRTKPTSLDYSTLACYDGATVLGVSTLAVGGGSLQSTPSKLWIDVTATVGQTQYRPYWLITNNSTSGYLGCSAEL